jgi:hypothetical protein
MQISSIKEALRACMLFNVGSYHRASKPLSLLGVDNSTIIRIKFGASSKLTEEQSYENKKTI